MQDGEFRSDVPAGSLALAVAGLTDLALVQHWATGAPGRAWPKFPHWCSPCSSVTLRAGVASDLPAAQQFATDHAAVTAGSVGRRH
jgi:hypothetical protein